MKLRVFVMVSFVIRSQDPIAHWITSNRTTFRPFVWINVSNSCRIQCLNGLLTLSLRTLRWFVKPLGMYRALAPRSPRVSLMAAVSWTSHARWLVTYRKLLPDGLHPTQKRIFVHSCVLLHRTDNVGVNLTNFLRHTEVRHFFENDTRKKLLAC